VSKISELSDGGSLVSTDYLIVVRSGGNVKVQMDTINVDQVDLGDNEFIRLGNSQDLTLVHTSTQSIINQAGVGDLLLQKAGTTKASITANGLEFPDNSKAIFGAGSDLQIYHDPAAGSIIQEGGSGSLFIRASTNIQLEGVNGENMAIFNENGSVQLYYNNAQKLATTATGIDVTGTVTADGLTVDGTGVITNTSGSSALNIKGNNGTQSNTVLRFTDTDPTSGTGQEIGKIEFYSTDSSAVVADIRAVGADASPDGNLLFRTAEGTTLANRLRIQNTGDISFYDDSDNAKFFWDASAESLGIGTSSPSTEVHVLKAGSDADVTIEGTGTGFDARLNLYANSTGVSQIRFGDEADTNIGLLTYDHSDNSMQFRVNDSERLRIDASGNVGIGTSSPSSFFSGASNLVVSGGSGNGGITIDAGTSSTSALHFADGTSGSETYIGYVSYNHSSNALLLGTSGVERMRIDASGNLLVGVASTTLTGGSLTLPNSGIIAFHDAGGSARNVLQFVSGNIKHGAAGGGVTTQSFYTDNTLAATIDSSQNLLVGTTASVGTSPAKLEILGGTGGGRCINTKVTVDTSANHINFNNGNGQVGSISTNGTATTYNTSSDQRLKENIADADDAGSKIDAIQVRKFDWKADGSHQDYGMVAQELLEVAPEAVSQGETEEDMMGVDYSKLVPMMLKEIQSLRARIAALES